MRGIRREKKGSSLESEGIAGIVRTDVLLDFISMVPSLSPGLCARMTHTLTCTCTELHSFIDMTVL